MNFPASRSKHSSDSLMGGAHCPRMTNGSAKSDNLYGEMPFTSHLVTYNKNLLTAPDPFLDALI